MALDSEGRLKVETTAAVKPTSVSRIPSAAGSVNATSAKAAAGEVWLANGYNAKAAVVYLKIYNKATAPTVGTDTPFVTLAIPALSTFNFEINGLEMDTGIGYGFTTDATDNGATALTAGDILGFNLVYS
jgi:hypothetical protein